MSIRYTIEGMDEGTTRKVVEVLQERLVALLDLQLTLKHIHWNVVGPHFIAVHEMLDPQAVTVRGYTDDMAERIATLGGQPDGTPGKIVDVRTWDNYDKLVAGAQEHLEALNAVYDGVIKDHRAAREMVEDLDPITEDLLVEQTRGLEMAQWFVRSHLDHAA